MMNESKSGVQRHSSAALRKWEALGYGMFLHFGMSTYDGEELSNGKAPVTDYAPDKLDVEGWISLVRDAGMKYAVLTTKHVAGFSLWPSKHHDYHVGNSGNKTDVVEKFVRACEAKGIMAGLYYCSWDNHNTFGSMMPCALPDIANVDSYTTPEYHEFQSAQIKELLTQYGKIGEVWIDIPGILPRHYRNRLYQEIASLQPEAMVLMNNGIDPKGQLKVAKTWPTDLLAIERFPPDTKNKPAWLGVPSALVTVEGKDYDLPREYCDTVGSDWFCKEGDVPRSDAELLGLYLLARSRGANVLFDVGPDKSGWIPKPFADAMLRLGKNREKLGLI